MLTNNKLRFSTFFLPSDCQCTNEKFRQKLFTVFHLPDWKTLLYIHQVVSVEREMALRNVFRGFCKYNLQASLLINHGYKLERCLN